MPNHDSEIPTNMTQNDAIAKIVKHVWTCHFIGFNDSNLEYSFKNITFCHCCVWKKQL